MNYYPNCEGLRHAYHARLRTYSLRVITEPVVEQITLDQARLHLRLDSYGSPPEHMDDSWITASIPAAREWCEFYSGRSLASQVIELALPRFPHAWSSYPNDEIHLPMGPIAGVQSVVYLDEAGAEQTLDPAAYAVDVSQDVGYVYPIINTSWPMTMSRPNAIRVRFNAGYTSPDESPDDMPLPKRYRSAMLLVLGHLYENRENVAAGGDGATLLHEIPLGAASLLDGTRLRLGFA